jgi:hypothetical protein
MAQTMLPAPTFTYTAVAETGQAHWSRKKAVDELVRLFVCNKRLTQAPDVFFYLTQKTVQIQTLTS